MASCIEMTEELKESTMPETDAGKKHDREVG
jgi:hypothetical protein